MGPCISKELASAAGAAGLMHLVVNNEQCGLQIKLLGLCIVGDIEMRHGDM